MKICGCFVDTRQTQSLTLYRCLWNNEEHFTINRTKSNWNTSNIAMYGKRKSDGAFVQLGNYWNRYSEVLDPWDYESRSAISSPDTWRSETGSFRYDATLIGVREQNSDTLIKQLNVDITLNFRLAKNPYSAKNYLIYGDESGLIDEGDKDLTERDLYENLYFKQEYWRGVMSDPNDPNSFYADGYYIDGEFKNADMDADFYAHYKFNMRDLPNLCMYIGTAETPHGTHAEDYYCARCNLYLLERDNVVYDDSETFPVFCYNMGTGGRYKTVSSAIGDGLTPIGVAPKMVISLGNIQGIDYDLFGYNMQTNIPIFRTKAQAEQYLRGEIGKEQAINDVGFNIPQGNLTGHELRGHEYNSVSAEAVCSECLFGNQAQFSDFFNTLFDTTNQESILDGLKLYGTEPASFIVDTFVIPFDASNFQDSTSINEVSFGSYKAFLQGSINKASKLNPKVVHAFDVTINGGFNDWRDYASEYYLALPYVGRNIHIDKEKYLYKTLSCDTVVDIRTGAIKYYLKCNGVCVDTYEGVCRISTPIQTTNNYSYSREKLGASASVVGNAMQLGISLATANPLGVVGSAVGITNSSLDLTETKKVSTTGNCSPSTAWCDPLECYLIVQTPEFVYPSSIASNYGTPSNIVTELGNLSGWVEVSDIKLVAPCTPSEKAEIESTLSNGIII